MHTGRCRSGCTAPSRPPGRACCPGRAGGSARVAAGDIQYSSDSGAFSASKADSFDSNRSQVPNRLLVFGEEPLPHAQKIFLGVPQLEPGAIDLAVRAEILQVAGLFSDAKTEHHSFPVHFMVFTETFDADVMCRFLDRHFAHRSRKVRAWLDNHPDQIELHFLPSYSPELNPDELVNADLKRSLPMHHRARDQAQLAAETCRFFHRRQRQPHIIRGYFSGPHVRYVLE